MLAKADLKNIKDFVAKDSKYYAMRHVTKILKRTQVLKKYPKAGKVVVELEDEQVRELVLGNYRIIYEIVSDSRIDILTIHHSARDLTKRNIK